MNRALYIFLTVLLILITYISSGQEAGERQFFKEYWVEKSYILTKATINRHLDNQGLADGTITINNSDTLSIILPTQKGVNKTFRKGNDQLTRTHLYQEAGIGSMRFPAGSGSNIYFYDGVIPSEFEIDISPIDGSKSTSLTPELFSRFIKDAGSRATVVVNYFYARYGKTAEGTRAARVQQAADYAAGFVHKMNVELGAGIKHWEIGNECYGAWEEGYNVNGSIVTGKEYGEDLRVFADAMKAVDPTIKIGAVVTREDDEWNSGLLPEVKDHADFLVVHNYFTSNANATAENILGSVGQIETIINTLYSCVEKYTGYASDYFPIAMTEFNSRGPYNCTMVNGLFITQVLGELMKNGYGMADLWVSEWSWNETDQESKGFLARDDPDQADYTPRQSYIPFHLYSKCFGDIMIASSSDNSDLKVYASKFRDGEIGIVVVNETASDLSFNIDWSMVTGAEDYNKVHWYEFYANSITPGDKRFYINGQTGTTPGGGPENFAGVEPFESVISPQTVFPVKKYSVNYYVLHNKPETAKKYNILFIAVDDLKPVLGSFGESQVVTPRMDRLSESGMIFTRAYCQWAVCGPSRASIMTGQSPDGTGIRNLTSQLRDESPGLVTLPELFRNSGYITAAAGKVYDPRNVDSGHDIQSWTIPYADPGDYTYPAEYGSFVQGTTYRVSPNTATEKGPPGVGDDGYQDGQICLDALGKIDQFAQNPEQPFFLAVGFKKPHIPFISPEEYWNLYNPDTLDIAEFQKIASGSPGYAYHTPEPIGYDDIPDPWTYDDVELGDNILDIPTQRRLIHGYYASVSYIDAQVGKLLDKLEEKNLEENTIVVLYGDHGYHLGDHNQWGKHTNFENAARAPLIIYAPGGQSGIYNGPVDLMDIYPTLCELTGINPPSNQMQGLSLAPVLRGENFEGKTTAVTEYRSDGGSGYSFRTDRYRLSLWFYSSEDRTDVSAWDESDIKDIELYDYTADPLETENLYGLTEYGDIVDSLMAVAESWWNQQYQFFQNQGSTEINLPFIEHFENYSPGQTLNGDFWFSENSLWDRFWKNEYLTSYNCDIVDDLNEGSRCMKILVNSKDEANGGGTFKLRTIDMTGFNYDKYIVSYKARTDSDGLNKARLGANINSMYWHEPGITYTHYFDTVTLSNGRLFIYLNNLALENNTEYTLWIDDLKVSAWISTGTDFISDDEDPFNLKIYPNPSSGRIYIAADGIIQSATVYDINGIPLISQIGNSRSIDISRFSTGIYIVSVDIEDKRIFRRIIKR